ncbi:unnamed protein product [Caenorhabditis brenneri]
MADFVSFINYNGNGHQKCTISDLNVNFGVTVPTDGKIKDYFVLVHTNVMDIIPTVQKLILSFFHTSVPSRLDIKIDENLAGFPKINGVEESTVSGENLEGAFVERFFSMYPNQKRSRINAKNIKNLEETSKLFDLDCLSIEYSTTIATTVLKQFKGSHLFLFNSELKIEEIIQFFQRWKSGEAHQNLEYLYIKLKSGQFEREVAMTQLEAKPWDPTKRPMMFRRSPKLFEWLLTSDENDPYLNCRRTLDIERKDGRLASIHIDPGFLRVCVWTDSQLKMDKNE